MDRQNLGVGFGGGDASGGPPPPDPSGDQCLDMGLAVLEVIEGRAPGVRLALDRVCMVIGRHDPPNVEVDIDLTAQELAEIPVVSRRHAEASWVEGRLMLRDLGSNNGTFVNDARLPSPGRGQPGDAQELHAGDRVRLANITVLVVTQ
jgi:pSer/pThr/pTyr-binding forkhead associated (FHA) protein